MSWESKSIVIYFFLCLFFILTLGYFYNCKHFFFFSTFDLFLDLIIAIKMKQKIKQTQEMPKIVEGNSKVLFEGNYLQLIIFNL